MILARCQLLYMYASAVQPEGVAHSTQRSYALVIGGSDGKLAGSKLNSLIARPLYDDTGLIDRQISLTVGVKRSDLQSCMERVISLLSAILHALFL